jgi:hypothetical protein
MPTPNALLDVLVLLIDASFIGLWALVGLALVRGGLDVMLGAWERWRSR